MALCPKHFGEPNCGWQRAGALSWSCSSLESSVDVCSVLQWVNQMSVRWDKQWVNHIGEWFHLFRTANSKELQEDLTHSQLSDWRSNAGRNQTGKSKVMKQRGSDKMTTAQPEHLLEKDLEYCWEILWDFWYSAMEGKNTQMKYWILPGEEVVVWIIRPSHGTLQP